MNEELLKTIKEQGLLLEKEVYDLVSSFDDPNIAKNFLISFEKTSGNKVLTKSFLAKNVEFVKSFVSNLPGENKSSAEKVFVKLGLSLEIVKEKEVQKTEIKESRKAEYKIFCADTKAYKKLEVADFTGNFRSRYQQLQRILMQRADLTNLVSINKISSERQNLSIIGMVTDKRITKNKNLIITVEDLTGKIPLLIRADKAELLLKASELQLDDVIAIKASGSRDIIFAYDIYFPEAHIQEKMKFEEDFSIAFLSDVHAGSKRHLGKSFNGFLEWINSEDREAKKIKYIFFLGDNVDGVGIFPGQDEHLALQSMKEQYSLLASYLHKIPKNITMFMCPGQHDAVRVAEPQPIIDRRYASPLYEIENLVLVTNPSMIKLCEGSKEFKILMYHGASFHSFINEIAELREQKANFYPTKVVRHILKRRHLAPTHSSMVYIPNADKDPLVISEVPDVIATGDMHRTDIDSCNGVLMIAGSCWQGQTDFEEKIGNIPDPGKVPILNVKTREMKVLSFLDEEELGGE